MVSTLYIPINTTFVTSAGLQPMLESLHKPSVSNFRSVAYRKKSIKKEKDLLRTATISKGERSRLLNISYCELNQTHTARAL